MKIHHLNCISSCPLGGKLMDDRGLSIVQRGHLTCHCLLVESAEGLVLIDTGFGIKDVENPESRLSKFFLFLVKPAFRLEMTARRQVERMGFKASDVRHIVLTHLDFDHAGGLDDFPGAKIHLLHEEEQQARAQKTWMDRQRFRPQQWSTQSNWVTYGSASGERWFGFDSVRQLQGLPPEILFIPLKGHTFGHAGVAVDRGDKWLLQAGDAYFFHKEMHATDPSCTPGLRFYQWMLEKDRSARLENQRRLRQLKAAETNAVEVFCAHDVFEFERVAGRRAEIPASQMVTSSFRAASSATYG